MLPPGVSRPPMVSRERILPPAAPGVNRQGICEMRLPRTRRRLGAGESAPSLLQNKDICARVSSSSGPPAHTFFKPGCRELQGIGYMAGGKADGQAVVWRPIPCATQGPGCATAAPQLRDGYGTPRFGGRLGSGQRRREPCRRRGNCDARVCRISYAAGAAPSLAVTSLRTSGPPQRRDG